MIEVLKKILIEKYLITSSKIYAQQGGWASLAYKIEDNNGHLYFLKVYEKSRKSTPYLIKHIDIYLPIVDWCQVRREFSAFIRRDFSGYRQKKLFETNGSDFQASLHTIRVSL